MIVRTFSKEKVILADEPIASGGEGEVRKILSCPAKFGDVCAKLYFKPRQTKEQEGKIRFMVENPPSTIIGDGMMLAWPLETLYKPNGEFIGFIMPVAYPNSNKLVILTLPKLKKAYKEEWYKFDKELDIKTALVSRMMLLNNIAIPIHFLHATGKYILKDFKPDNVLVTPDGRITIVDMDSIQICDNGKLLFPGTASTESYMPPEFYNKGVGRKSSESLNVSWDNFALAEVFYQLMFGLNPYAVSPKTQAEDSNTLPYCISHNLFPFGNNASKIATIPAPHNNFNIIPQPIRLLFIRAFGETPQDRPSAMEWGKTINQVLRSMPKTSAPTPPKSSPKPPKSPSSDSGSDSNPAPVKYCPKCGVAVPLAAKFCKACGYSFEKGEKPKEPRELNKPLIALIILAIVILLAIIILNG